jgi:hypothetical protein
MEEFRESRSEEGSWRFKEASDRHSKVLIQEEMFWKQRAKMHWLKDGDSNTKFFHMSASARNSRKKIKKLTDQNGNTVTNQDELCDVAQRYFEDLFRTNIGVHEPVLNLIQRNVSESDNVMLTQPVTKEEIRQALWHMHPNKAPGPDGFNPAFFQHYWDICGDDIWRAANSWLERGFFPSHLNETNICLIPKCDNPESMKDLRPIALCNVLYKMISKVLANRLRVLLDKLVSHEQSAFVEGRSILDNALVAIEIIHAMKRRTRGRKGDLALKIDISKAYDRVDWGFLRRMLEKLGSAETWVKWLMMCVSTVNYSVLLNYDRIGPIYIPG